MPRLTRLLFASLVLLAACTAEPGGGSGGTGMTGAAAPATVAPAAAPSILAPSRARAPLVRAPLPPGLPPLTPLQGPPPEAPYARPDATPASCASPRPARCNLDYKPVCASVDTGVRCIRAPCPSSERKTFGSACKACRDPAVATYVEGRCPPT